MTPASAGFLSRLGRWGTALENAILVLLLGAMMVLAVTQIALRIFFSAGFVWSDELLKLMVLWIAMIASIAASRSDRHLRIDILSHFVAEKYARVPRMIVETFAAGICAVLAWQSYRFIQIEIEFGDTVLVDIPAWLVHGIMPLAFALMCYRFSLSAVGDLTALFRPERNAGARP